MRISDWSSDVCSSDLAGRAPVRSYERQGTYTAGSCHDAADQPSGDTAMNQAAMQDFGKLVLRIALGALILLHGISKLRTGPGPIAGMVVSYGRPGLFAYGALIGEGRAPPMLLVGFYGRRRP